MKKWYIYIITNKVNGKQYVGQRIYDSDMITPDEDSYMGSGKLLPAAFNKYGIEQFEKRILMTEIETKKRINELEKYYIIEFKCKSPAGYNLTDGGDGGTWQVGQKHSIETKQKLSIIAKNRKMSDATKLKISETNKRLGKRPPSSVGRKLSESHKAALACSHINHRGDNSPMKRLEVRAKISKALKGRTFSAEHCDKISNALKGKPKSAEHTLKNSIGHMGVKLSDETKKKMSDSHKKLWLEKQKLLHEQ